MPKVKFINNGEEAEASQGQELEEVTKSKGWPIAYGCGDGMCGTCVIKTAQGGLSEMTEKEKQTLGVMGMDDGQHRLACQCKVEGDCEIEGM